MRKVLWTQRSRWQIVGAVVGAFAGIFLLLISIQIYDDITDALEQERDLIGGDYLVINKKVSILGTANVSSPVFKDREIKQLQDQDFIDKIGFFTPNRFEVFGSFNSSKKRDTLFLSSMFFESVPDEFLDLNPKEWDWEPGDSLIPIIVPGDYVNLYNFALAPSQDLRLLSKKTIEKARFSLSITTRSGKAMAYASIVGYSDRLNSVLVPQTFMEYANKNWGTKEAKPPSRLILRVKDITDDGLAAYLQDKNYETNQEQMRGSRLRFIMTIIVGIASLIGLLIVGLSLLIFVMSFRLLIARSARSIELLLHLGFKFQDIAKHYAKLFAILFGVVLVLTYIALIGTKMAFLSYMSENDLHVSAWLSEWVIIGSVIFVAVFFTVNTLDIRRQVKELGK